MSSLAASLAAGLLLGLSLAAPPGPMNAIIAEESVLRGWAAGFRAGLGAMSADACFLALALIGVVAVLQRAPLLRSAMLAVGGVLMLYFALGAARSARDSFVGQTGGPGKGFRKAFVLSLTNPFQILWWLSVGVVLLEPGTIDLRAWLPLGGAELGEGLVVATGGVPIVGGLFAGIAIWIVAFPAALALADERVDWFAPVVAVASALLLAAFGVVFLFEAAVQLRAV